MKRALAIAAVLTVTACGGGGGSSSVPSSAIPSAPASPAGVTSRQAVGSATLTIAYPATFGTAKAAASAARSPKYVNPNTSNTIDVYVDQQLATSVAVNSSNGDGTQTLSIPLYSTSSNDILVIERDGSNNLLALGQSTLGQFSPGNANSIQLSMSMNVYAFAVSFDDSTATQVNNGNTLLTSGSYPGTTGNGFWVVPIDASGGYSLTSLAGSGGMPSLGVSIAPSPSNAAVPSNIVGPQPSNNEYFVNYDAAGDAPQMTINVSSNPANVAYNNLPSADQSITFGYNQAPYYNSSESVNFRLCPTGICP